MANLLSTAFGLYKRHFILIAVLTLAVWLPCEMIQSYLEYEVIDPDNMRASFKLTRFFEGFFGIIATASILCSLERAAAGETPAFGSSLREGLSFWVKLWWANFVLGITLLLGLLLLVIPALFVLVQCSLLGAIVVREGVTGTAAIKRCFAITRGYFWRLFGWFTVAGLLALLAGCPLFFLTSIPVLDHWLPDAVCTALFDVVFAYLTVFIWVVLDHIQSEQRIERNALMGTLQTDAKRS